MIRHILIVFCLILSGELPALAQENIEGTAREPVTILISIDGFRPDYLDRGITPNLNALAKAGIEGPMRPSFPTKTFPNHYTLVTGKTPDGHGVVGNRMEDKARPGERFTMASKDPFWWDQAEPIWITAEKQGVRSATMFWPGSEISFGGVRPSDWWPFSEALSNDRRIRAVVDWMRRPAESRPKLVTLYFDTVDTAGHFYGPAPSDKLHDVIQAMDTGIGFLRSELDALGQPVNLVIVSDHGMAEVGPERVIRLDEIYARDQYRLVESGNYAGIEPLGDDTSAIEAAFLKPHDNMQCWRRENIPARFAYGTNPRVPTIFCLPETGWLVYQDVPEWLTRTGGGHGYDNFDPDMTALFIASGRGIAAGGGLDIFDNVDIYALVAHLAGVRPEPSDGSVEHFLPKFTQ